LWARRRGVGALHKAVGAVQLPALQYKAEQAPCHGVLPRNTKMYNSHAKWTPNFFPQARVFLLRVYLQAAILPHIGATKMPKASKRNIKLSTSTATATAKPATAQATPSHDISERRATARKLSNTAYADHAAYPFGKLSATDRLYVALFAKHAKSGNGEFSTSALDLADAKPAGISITNNRARAHRLTLAGFLSRKSDDVFSFVPAIVKPSASEKRADVLYAITTYKNA